MTPTTRTPTAQEAINYALHLFNEINCNHDSAVLYFACGTIAPGRDSSGPLLFTRDVLLVTETDPQPIRLTVWHEHAPDGTTYLYGEW